MATVLISHAQQFDTPQDVLAHYGVKGMKWGVRKNREGSGKKSIPDTRTDAERRRSRNKKIAIGVAVVLRQCQRGQEQAQKQCKGQCNFCVVLKT